MNKVRFEKHGMLYVETTTIDDKIIVVKIKNPMNTIPTEVEIVKVKEEYYIKGYEPKVTKRNSISSDK